MSDGGTKPRSDEGKQFPRRVAASPCRRVIRRAFTLLETVATLLLLALLATAMTLSFRAPLNRAKAAHSIEQLRFADTAARALAQKTAKPAELAIDLDNNTLARRDPRTGEILSLTQIPFPWRIAAFRTSHSNSETGQHTVRFSPRGLTQSYAIKLAGPDDQARWVFFAGLSPDSRTDLDDSQIASILAAASPRRHVD